MKRIYLDRLHKSRWEVQQGTLTKKLPVLLLIVLLCGLQRAMPVCAVTITTNTVWEGEILLEESVFVPFGVTLTVLPGTHIKFKHYRGYRESEKRLNLNVSGTLIAEGTAEEPIYFTSDAPEPQNGDWSMIHVRNSTNSVFRYCVVEFGQQGINFWDGSPEISHCVIRWHNWEGLYFESYSEPSISYCHIVENGYNGLAAEQFNTITMDYCEVERSGTNGVHIDASLAEIRRSLVHDNLANGLSVDNNGTLRALGVAINNNGVGRGGCGIGIGEGTNIVEVDNVALSGNQSGNICGLYSVVEAGYTIPASIDIGFTPDMSYELGYIPGDPKLDGYMYVYPDDETRRIVRKIGDRLGLTWSLAWDSQYIWTSTLWGKVSKINPQTGKVLQQFAAPGSQPWGMTYDGQNLWIVDFAEKRISKVDPATGSELATYPTPDPLGGCKGVTWDGSYLCVMGWTSPKIYKMDRQGNLIDTIALDSGGGGGIAWDGEYFWVPGGQILKYDSEGHKVGWIYPASEGTWDMTWDGQYLWASQRTNENWDDAKIFALEILEDHHYQPGEETLTWYVDGTNAGDGDGTASNPYRTITQALNAANTGGKILVAQGTYTENFALNSKIDLYGGYASYTLPNAWTRSISLYETIIDGNQNGSVVTFDSGASVLDGFTITGGSASEAGGGITVTGGSPTIQSCIIRGNTARSNGEWCGGGILIDAGLPVIRDTIIINNSVLAGASGVRVGDTSFTMINSLVVSNSGRWAIHANEASITLINVTIAEHGFYGGVFLNNSQATVSNSILWEESGPDIEAESGGSYTITYSNVEDGVLAGAGNISVDPRFADKYDDYHLKSKAGRWNPSNKTWVFDRATSPCVDAGNTSSDWTAELWPHGKRINMGAYGGTAQASMSKSDLGNVADLDNNDIVDFEDFACLADVWQIEKVLLPEDLDRNGCVNNADLQIFVDEWLWQQ